MSSESVSRPSFRSLLASIVIAAVLVAGMSAITVAPFGIWRWSEYDFAIPEFWPEALRAGRTLSALPETPAPRWLITGSSIVLYDIVPDAVAAAAATPARQPHVVKLAVPSTLFTDAVILTQVAHERAPLTVAVAGVHPRDFDVSVEPRTTLVAQTFDHAGIEAAALAGGSPAHRFERALVAIWPGLRVRRLQTRIFHQLVPNPGTLPRPASEPPPPDANAAFDWQDTPLSPNRQRDELVPWIHWCLARDIRPVVVYFPERLSDPAAAWPREHGDAWLAMLETDVRAAGGVFLSARTAARDDDFYDFNHLRDSGAVAYSSWLGRRLRLVLDPAAPVAEGP